MWRSPSCRTANGWKRRRPASRSALSIRTTMSPSPLKFPSSRSRWKCHTVAYSWIKLTAPPFLASFRKCNWWSLWLTTIALELPNRLASAWWATMQPALSCGTGPTCWRPREGRSPSGTHWRTPKTVRRKIRAANSYARATKMDKDRHTHARTEIHN